jgi:hypothetical protein
VDHEGSDSERDREHFPLPQRGGEADQHQRFGGHARSEKRLDAGEDAVGPVVARYSDQDRYAEDRHRQWHDRPRQCPRTR